MSTALETVALGKRYGRQWALHDCTLRVPAGSVTALVGPNGAGKTTLLQLAVGLLRPSAGTVRVFGWSPVDQPLLVLARVGFVAQDHPLYRGFTVAEILRVGRALNPRWDDRLAADRLAALGIPLGRRVGALSGGQQAQVALVLALAKRPDLLLLDEPVAALDPLARREFLQTLMDAVADQEVTVVLSSHILADLERVCDHLIILSAAEVRLAGDIDEITARHKLLLGPRERSEAIRLAHHVILERTGSRQSTLLARLDGPVADPAWTVDDVTLEELVLAYLGAPLGAAPSAAVPSLEVAS